MRRPNQRAECVADLSADEREELASLLEGALADLASRQTSLDPKVSTQLYENSWDLYLT